MKKILLFVIPFLFLIGCAKQADAPVTDTQTETQTGTETAVSDKDDFTLATEMIDSKYPGWVAFWKTKDPDFNWKGFTSTGEGVLAFELNNAYTGTVTELEKKFYPFSPDGNKFIEPYSGRARLSEENGKLVVSFADGEPDSYVNMIDLEKKELHRAISCGTPCSFEGAGWIDDNRFFIFGSSEDNDMKKIPAIFIFDMEKKTRTVYTGAFAISYEDFWNDYKLEDMLGVTTPDEDEGGGNLIPPINIPDIKDITIPKIDPEPDTSDITIPDIDIETMPKKIVPQIDPVIDIPEMDMDI